MGLCDCWPHHPLHHSPPHGGRARLQPPPSLPLPPTPHPQPLQAVRAWWSTAPEAPGGGSGGNPVTLVTQLSVDRLHQLAAQVGVDGVCVCGGWICGEEWGERLGR